MDSTRNALIENSSQSAGAARWFARLRVRHWAHFLALPLAAFSPSNIAPFALVRGVVIAACILAFGYLLNGIADRTHDSDPSKNPFVVEPTSGVHVVVVTVFALIALALAMTAPSLVLIATIIALLAGWSYSSGPRLKRFPFVGTTMNAACFVPLLFVGATIPMARNSPLLAAIFAALLIENQLLHEGEDALDDARGRVRTTYAVVGNTATACLMAALGASTAWTTHALGGGISLAASYTITFAVVFPIACFYAAGNSQRLARLRSLHRLASLLAGAATYWLSIQ